MIVTRHFALGDLTTAGTNANCPSGPSGDFGQGDVSGGPPPESSGDSNSDTSRNTVYHYLASFLDFDSESDDPNEGNQDPGYDQNGQNGSGSAIDSYVSRDRRVPRPCKMCVRIASCALCGFEFRRPR